MPFPKLLTKFSWRGKPVKVFRNRTPYYLAKTKTNLYLGPIFLLF